MLYVRASWIVILVGFAGVAKAVDLDLSMTTTVAYDDNVFRTDKDTKDDASFRFGPTIRIRDETSDLSYNVSYNPVYEKFVTWTDADDLSHFVHGALEYQLSDQTLLSLSENFRFAQSLNRYCRDRLRRFGERCVLCPDGQPRDLCGHRPVQDPSALPGQDDDLRTRT